MHGKHCGFRQLRQHCNVAQIHSSLRQYFFGSFPLLVVGWLRNSLNTSRDVAKPNIPTFLYCTSEKSACECLKAYMKMKKRQICVFSVFVVPHGHRRCENTVAEALRHMWNWKNGKYCSLAIYGPKWLSQIRKYVCECSKTRWKCKKRQIYDFSVLRSQMAFANPKIRLRML